VEYVLVNRVRQRWQWQWGSLTLALSLVLRNGSMAVPSQYSSCAICGRNRKKYSMLNDAPYSNRYGTQYTIIIFIYFIVKFKRNKMTIITNEVVVVVEELNNVALHLLRTSTTLLLLLRTGRER
jgi:hypothetical protein